jgi:hypothetical protein
LAGDRADSPDDLDHFAFSLEELLASPAPLRGEAEAATRKRAAGSAPAGEPSTSRARLDTPQETAFAHVERRPRAERAGRNENLWGRLLQWGSGRLFGTPDAGAGPPEGPLQSPQSPPRPNR